MGEDRKARVIAFYLPQFHPIPENDKWWGKGFTEWTNVGKAKPLFKGHYQPRVPADLGYYDLRLPEVREAQAQMAREAGIEGFCYWHYWLGNGKRLLERPFNEVLESGKPDFPFCLGWANHSWSNKTWDKGSSKVKDTMLMEQVYSKEDYIAHFNEVLKAFQDPRYIQVDGKPLFLVYEPYGLPDASEFISLWQDLAIKNGLKGIHFVGITYNQTLRDPQSGKLDLNGKMQDGQYKRVLELGFDAINSRGTIRAELIAKGKLAKLVRSYIRKKTDWDLIERYDYEEIIKYLFIPEDKREYVYPTLLPNWDRTARSGKGAVVYHNSNPELFSRHIQNALEILQNRDEQHKILFVQSWNEWAEGNYVEPDLCYGDGYLRALEKSIMN